MTEGAGDEQAAQIAVPLFTDTAEPILAAKRSFRSSGDAAGKRSDIVFGKSDRCPLFGPGVLCRLRSLTKGLEGTRPGNAHESFSGISLGVDESSLAMFTAMLRIESPGRRFNFGRGPAWPSKGGYFPRTPGCRSVD